MIDYYIYFNNDYFESTRMFYLGLIDNEKKNNLYWCLTEKDPKNWLKIKEEIIDVRNKFKINSNIFYQIKHLSDQKKIYILKYNNPIKLFKAWNLLEQLEEYLI
jgi:hypothetical protein